MTATKMNLKLTLAATVAAITICATAATGQKPARGETNMEKKNYYCEYCGHKFPNVQQLASATCQRHPNGSNRGRHKLYEGSEKSSYTCKHCGKKFPSIMVMVGGTCPYHPNGANKGSHSPAL